jgi:6-phosphogluconolactonase
VIRIFNDTESLSRAAATLFSEESQLAVQLHGRFDVVLCGGRTPQRMHEILAQPPFRQQIPWLQTHIFWGDERCVPLHDPRSNEKWAREELLNEVPVSSDHIHPIRCHKSPRDAAEAYESKLRKIFDGHLPQFDLIFLGLGSNGHTASLFPDTDVLEEDKRWAAEVYVKEDYLHRVTLTVPVINNAKHVVFLVSGAEKASVLHQVLEGPFTPRKLPAQLIQPTNGNITWLVDKAARYGYRHNQ